MPNPGLSPARMALQSAYTEAEAMDEVIRAALDCLEGRCIDSPDFDEEDESTHGCRDVYRAISLWQTYRGVK